MIFSSSGPRDDLSETIRNFLLDAIARNNNSLENLEVITSEYFVLFNRVLTLD